MVELLRMDLWRGFHEFYYGCVQLATNSSEEDNIDSVTREHGSGNVGALPSRLRLPGQLRGSYAHWSTGN